MALPPDTYSLNEFLKCCYGAALACIIRQHFRQLLFVIACDAVRQHMNRISDFRHIEAGGFDAGRGVGAGNIKPGNATFLNESGKSIACKRVAF